MGIYIAALLFITSETTAFQDVESQNLQEEYNTMYITYNTCIMW